MLQAGAAAAWEDLGVVSLCNNWALLGPIPAIRCQSQANLSMSFSCSSPNLKLYKLPLLSRFSALID